MEPQPTSSSRPIGMRAFVIIWIGQIVSMLGTAMTGFAVTIWVYEGTEKATALALVTFFYAVPLLLLSPLAGAIVDRSNRRLMMMVSDLAAGASTLVVLLLYSTGRLEMWHLYLTNAVAGAFQAFQWPAYSAAISLMLPKEQYARANAMLELAGSGANVFAPMLAGALLVPLGLTGILLIDVASFVFAVGTLLVVKIPELDRSAGRPGQGSLLEESLYGFQYILRRPALLNLQLIFLLCNFFTGVAYHVFAAMILSRTGNNELALGSVMSAGAVGGLVGGLLMTAWGGPKRRIHGVLVGWTVLSVPIVVLGVGRVLPIWLLANLLINFVPPFLNGSNQAIWQAKVPPGAQGRVFATRRMIAWFVSPIAMLLAGPLSDSLLEPAMREGGALTGLLGWLVGTGPGAGMALLFVAGGALSALVALGGYLVPAVRNVERDLPDHDALPAGEPVVEEPAAFQWTPGRRLAVAAGALALAAVVVGLGYLQVVALAAP